LYIVFNSPTALTLDLLIETWEAGCRKGYPSNLSLDQVYRAQFPELSIKQNSMLVHLLQVGPKFGREYTHAHVTETQLHVGLTWNKAYSVANQ